MSSALRGAGSRAIFGVFIRQTLAWARADEQDPLPLPNPTAR
jgi:hypothetical protein